MHIFAANHAANSDDKCQVEQRYTIAPTSSVIRQFRLNLLYYTYGAAEGYQPKLFQDVDTHE